MEKAEDERFVSDLPLGMGPYLLPIVCIPKADRFSDPSHVPSGSPRLIQDLGCQVVENNPGSNAAWARKMKETAPAVANPPAELKPKHA